MTTYLRDTTLAVGVRRPALTPVRHCTTVARLRLRGVVAAPCSPICAHPSATNVEFYCSSAYAAATRGRRTARLRRKGKAPVTTPGLAEKLIEQDCQSRTGRRKSAQRRPRGSHRRSASRCSRPSRQWNRANEAGYFFSCIAPSRACVAASVALAASAFVICCSATCFN